MDMHAPLDAVQAPAALDLAIRALTTAVPAVEASHAAQVAAAAYGWQAQASLLTGERDRNFLLRMDNHPPVTLKFVSAAETLAETDIQVRVLAHLQARGCPVPVPQACPTQLGQDWLLHDTSQGPVRCRAYTYLEGLPATQAPTEQALRTHVGEVVAQMVQSLQGFEHPALERIFLWDVVHVAQLAPLTPCVMPGALRAAIDAFLAHFQSEVTPRLASLPRQAIHGDLSKSNLLVDPAQPSRIAGVLDFGDVVAAPAVAELAVAASYHMNDAPDPLQALQEVVDGYVRHQPLGEVEQHILLDLVMARLVQRIVIPEWRASRFPENRAYILRSNPDARQLLLRLLPMWAQRTGVLMPESLTHEA